MAKPPILPIDTVQAVWNSAFPALMQAIWGEDSADFDSKELLGTQGAELLTNQDALTTWFSERFHRDGLSRGSVFNPFGPIVVSTSDAIQWTFVVYPGGILLPRLTGVSSRPDVRHVRPIEPTREDIGNDVEWYASEAQILALRTAATLATVAQWRTASQPFDRGRFERDVATHRVQQQGGVAPTFKCHLVDINGAETKRRRKGRIYYNPEDGAGYFDTDGYHMFTPPAPPLMSGLLGKGDEENWRKEITNDCASYYASRQAYATPCTCLDVSAVYFKPVDQASASGA